MGAIKIPAALSWLTPGNPRHPPGRYAPLFRCRLRRTFIHGHLTMAKRRFCKAVSRRCRTSCKPWADAAIADTAKAGRGPGWPFPPFFPRLQIR